jgi:uncharacterized protein (UPF0276 family)
MAARRCRCWSAAGRCTRSGLHGVGLSLGSATGIDPWHLDRLHRLVQRIEPLRVSDHASFARGVSHTKGQARTLHAADLLPVPLSDEALGVMASNVHRVQERLGRAIAVENISAYIDWADETMDEPSFPERPDPAHTAAHCW